RDGELLLVQPQARRLSLRCKPEARREVEKHVRRLRDDQLAGAQERRRERPSLHRAAFHHMHHGLHALRTSAHIDVIGASVLERETDEFAAALDGRPVVKLVSHSTLWKLQNGRFVWKLVRIHPARREVAVADAAQSFGTLTGLYDV